MLKSLSFILDIC